ncbi:hypothetical protein HC031_05305 [Planosporangium thailandense]|uniref:Uncharacterized protein n=1 Tax=Planosporangium thailandense TaxID=765197 RepID=A0ABX0XT03_9ACTN|nr:hypothetical protein [Planosporangium thailandense]NJC69137.1 hypothetical protein [Planosporangium thailandense]
MAEVGILRAVCEKLLVPDAAGRLPSTTQVTSAMAVTTFHAARIIRYPVTWTCPFV